jgi:hypothetical protein
MYSGIDLKFWNTKKKYIFKVKKKKKVSLPTFSARNNSILTIKNKNTLCKKYPWSLND